MGHFKSSALQQLQKNTRVLLNCRASFSLSFQMVLDKTTLTSMALLFSWLDVGAPLSFCHMKAPRKNRIFILCFFIIWLWIKLTHSLRLMCSCLDCVEGTGSLRSRVYLVFHQFTHSEGIKVIPAGCWVSTHSQGGSRIVEWGSGSALASQIYAWFLFHTNPSTYGTVLINLWSCCMGFQLPKQWTN